MNVKYSAALYDLSGYAEAARSYCLALHSQKVKLTLQPFSFEPYRPKDVGHSSILQPLYNKAIDYNVHIIHMTPDHLPKLYEKGKYNISLSVWETNRLPSQWVNFLNNYCEECWVPSSYCADTWIRSGVKKPIFVMKHALDTEEYYKDLNGPKWPIENIGEDTYIFYSIYQWSERKNPSVFIEAYLREFNLSDKVALVLKTYYKDFSQNDTRILRSIIGSIKERVKKINAPKIYLIHGSLDRDQLNTVHMRGDCFLASFRSEGVGLPLVEAALAGRPVITPRSTGIVDYLPEELTHYYDSGPLIPSGGMDNISQLYTGDMQWHNPQVSQVREQLKKVYTNKEEAKVKGLALREHIKESFSFQSIGEQMVNRLKEITK